MIFACEGPDCSGKTTLFEALPGAKLKQPTMSPNLFCFMEEVEQVELALWESLYIGQHILCDRSLFVSGQVYARLYGRKLLDVTKWRSHVHVLYLDVSLPVLFQRCEQRGDDKFDPANFVRLCELYVAEVVKWSYCRIDGTSSLAAQVEVASAEIQRVRGTR